MRVKGALASSCDDEPQRRHECRRAPGPHVQSTTDPEARLFRKGPGKEAHLSFMSHVLMEHRNGLVVGFDLTLATGTAERDAALDLGDEARAGGFHPTTLAAIRTMTSDSAWPNCASAV